MDHSKDKVGSSPEDAAHMIGKGDFGVHESDVVERNYVSEETKRNDPGGGVARSGTGPRDSGVGGDDAGRGSSSGFDVDNDSLVGIGDPNKKTPVSPQTAAKPGERPVLEQPAVDLSNPTRAGALDNDSSTSADDANNETMQTGNSFKGDVTSDEAAGGA